MEPEDSLPFPQQPVICSDTEGHESSLRLSRQLFTSRQDATSQETSIFNNPHSHPATNLIPTWYFVLY